MKKICNKCKIEKDIEEFSKHKKNKDGRAWDCKECSKKYRDSWKIKHPTYNNNYKKENYDKIRDYDKQYKLKNREILISQCKEYHKSHRQQRREYTIKWRKLHPNLVKEYNIKNIERIKLYQQNHKEEHKKATKKWRFNNPGIVNAQTAKRRAWRVQATPSWLNSQQLYQMKEIYIKARKLTDTTGIIHEVDHVIPLKAINKEGEHIACGLHVPWNLQILTRSENRIKGNKLIIS